jgi:oxygen-independent coproporphyrinogen-3 oxidase
MTLANAANRAPGQDVKSELIQIFAKDGVTLELTRYSNGSANAMPVILTHGTFSNGTICSRLAAYLAAEGFDAWVLELRGRGASRGIVGPTFEAFGLLDVPAAVEAIRASTGRSRLFFVGHSGGGLAFLMHLARRPAERGTAQGLVMLASQATDACATASGRLMVAFGWVAEGVLGYTPGRALRLGPENEPKGILRQWMRWNRSGRWTGTDGFDYLDALSAIDVPTLCFAGAGDRYIAPVRGCRRLYEAVGGQDKTWILCARSEGFSEDFDHTRIVASRAAQREIWPRIREWLVERTN